MSDRPQIKDFDWTLLAIVAAINLLGLLEIYSSTHASAMSGMHWKQLIWLGVGVVVMFIMSQIDTTRCWTRRRSFISREWRDCWWWR